MSRWVYGCLCSAALWGCGDDACVRRSDCAGGMVCRAGVCVIPDGSAGGDASLDSAAADAPPDAAGSEGASPDANGDLSPADATDAGLDGGSDA